ncbi:MAG: DUF1294 domain-containing protein [Lachnospiraceae bacterium]|nr:DUF1294 domain-containing protein [Lachnospiraceae bacterium]
MIVTGIVVGYLVVVNIAGFALMRADKRRAVRHKWRIRESRLFLCAAIGGSLGSWAGMYVFRHKTKHLRFVLGMPVILALQIAAAVLIIRQFVL